ncbi:P2X purinoceptor 4b isoform X2 [Onychostoma macrolepis]|uniref:P2X purinoceptor 4b isoform X2 n=1 Tax=Onychostoma macrolepis TaxID=369639 RepID=UPI00272C0DC3|nr:P2X purinoceptor 4b isoform X2 [Onychostoma macrolepis]
MGCKNCCNVCLQCLFGYETNVMLVINNKTVGALFRLIQLLIIAYVAVYVCWIQRAYQDTDSVISSVSTKVKGNILTNSSIEGVHVWDVPEYVIPPQGENSFFVLTNMILTPGQTQSKCPEVRSNASICFVHFHTRRECCITNYSFLQIPSEVTKCESVSDCREGHNEVHGNGVQTGHCVKYSDTIKTCEVQAWCPLENDTIIPKPALLGAAEDFTVLIKNSIQYPKFNFRKRNILHHINSTYLKNCTFDRKTNPHCPIFRLGNMLTEAGEDFSVMALKGGIMGIFIDWNCDLDFPERFCIPKYSFSRLDNKNPENNVAPGYNFRFAKYYKNNENIETRTLIKAFGIRFDVIVFGMVTAVCNWVMLTCMKDRDYYAKHKFIHLNQKGDSVPLSSMETTSYGTP